MSKNTEFGFVMLGLLVLWGWVLFTFAPPVFWIAVVVLVFGILNSGGKGGSGGEYNGGQGGESGGGY